MLARFLFKRLSKDFSQAMILEVQSDYRAGSRTINIIFSARQIQKKIIELQGLLYQVFIHLVRYCGSDTFLDLFYYSTTFQNFGKEIFLQLSTSC